MHCQHIEFNSLYFKILSSRGSVSMSSFLSQSVKLYFGSFNSSFIFYLHSPTFHSHIKVSVNFDYKFLVYYYYYYYYVHKFNDSKCLILHM
jgi:hypothetical protein